MIERRTVFKAALAAGAATMAAACTGGGDDGSAGTGGGGATSPARPVAVITAEPAVDAKNVSVLQPVTVRVAQGTLTDVKLTNPDGKAVEGKLSDDKTSWTSSETLGYDKTYTYNASATGTDGKPVTLTGSFTTLKPASTVRVTLNPADDATVGVAMPVSVKFTSAVKNKAAVEKALKIETSTEVEGSWGWLSDQQVDWRPKEYWPANTTVKVEAKLYGTDLGGGAYPRADVTTEFKIGRNQVVKIHTPDHRMNVYRGGTLAKSYPCSNGKDSDVNLNTPNGTYIIMTKEPSAIFDNARYGYTNVNKKWACRISNHGEFIHENQDNAANIGRVNSSHGCVNLLEADAKDYFDSALIGDPVEITGSKLGPVVNSDVMDWLVSWSAWQAKSAL
ncbi:L,D-transpeptidase [Amycolatopsis thermophila]|uniref:Lipoprotein-anchoring transpeptidase ErfK/SrfK n=1 Tax=Amycolatopsis thermophila TaxID=206084 RepID=A0ABU0ER39_9PSEU|nr:Ig-like domain-containing protein [Amycolatopsis thermophila]MDQ0377756.1 lipoprotein-anchoring transpeptidase ErfK/SrfK [Amycolatopsis thermophila]